MAIATYNDLMARIASGYWMQQPIQDELTTATIGFSTNNLNLARAGKSKLLLFSLVEFSVPAAVISRARTITYTLLVWKIRDTQTLKVGNIRDAATLSI